MTTVQLQKDPESSELKLRLLSPQASGAIVRLRNAAYGDGRFPRKVKVLTALAISASIRCEPCLEYYAKESAESGVTLQELVEMLNVAIAMGGCPGEVWADKALKAFQKYVRDAQSDDRSSDENQADSCCE